MLRKLFIIQILLGAAIHALPAPAPAPVVAGDVILVKPKHLDNPMPRQAKIGLHPAVVLTGPDEHGDIKIAPISHSHPMNPPTRLLSDFYIDLPPAQGKTTPGTVSVATPATVHVDKVKISAPHRQVEPQHLEALKDAIRKTCGDHVVRRSDDHPDPCDRAAMARAARAKIQRESQSQQPAAGPSSHSDSGPKRPTRRSKKKNAQHKAASAQSPASHNQGVSGNSAQAGPSGTRHAIPHSAHSGSSGGARHSSSHDSHAGSSSNARSPGSNRHPNTHNAPAGTTPHSAAHNAHGGPSGSTQHSSSHKGPTVPSSGAHHSSPDNTHPKASGSTHRSSSKKI